MSLPLIRKAIYSRLGNHRCNFHDEQCLYCPWATTDAALSRHRYSACSST